MKVCVYGLWHLGSVTAACLSEAGFDTIGLDQDQTTIDNLSQGRPPLFEPGLEGLTQRGLDAGILSFTSNIEKAVAGADLVWVAFDTPVDDGDHADVTFVMERVESIFPYLKDGTVVLISSQLPVGSTRQLKERFDMVAKGRTVFFAYSPENLRLGRAIEVFKKPERIIVGANDDHTRSILTSVLQRFCDALIWVSIESAEMTKHALNAYLATCVTFINEIAVICERVGADAGEVEVALRTDPRIGPRAYVRPGAAFAGGTLARDVTFLNEIAEAKGLAVPLLGGILPSNQAHRRWPIRQLKAHLGDLGDRTIAVLGLAYKPDTDALRRSVSIELCRELQWAHALVQAYDPAVRVLPADLSHGITLTASPSEAAEGADALVVATEWPEFKDLSSDIVVTRMRQPLVLDQNRFLAKAFADDERIQYVTIGKPQ